MKRALLVFFVVAFFVPSLVFAEDLAIYVTNNFDNTVSVIDPATDTVTDTINVGTGPRGVAVLPDASAVYVANNGSNNVSVIDPTDNTEVDTISVGAEPDSVVANPNSTTVYVTNNGDNSVSIIDVESGTVTDTVLVGNSPRGLAITPDGAFLYVANTASDSVSVVDLSDNSVSSINIGGGSFPINVTISHDGAFAYVSEFLGSDVDKIDTSNNTIVDSALSGFETFSTVITNDDGLVYAVDAASQEVDLITTDPMTLEDNVSVGAFPRYGALNEDETKLYVTESDNATVGIVNTDTLVRTSVAVGLTPYGIAILRDVSAGAGALTVTITTPFDANITASGEVTPDRSFSYQVVVANTGGADLDDTQLVLTSGPYTMVGGRIHMEENQIYELSGDAGTSTSTITCTESGAKILTCDIGTLTAGDTRYFKVAMHVGDLTSGEVDDDFTATATSDSITANDSSTLTTLGAGYSSGCAFNIAGNRLFDGSREMKNTLLLFSFLIMPVLILRWRRAKIFLSLLLLIFLYSAPSIASTSRFSVNPDAPTLGSSGIIYTLGAKAPQKPYHFSFDTEYGYNHAKVQGVTDGIVTHLVTHYLGFGFYPKQKLGIDVVVPVLSVNQIHLINHDGNKPGIGDITVRGRIPLVKSKSGKTNFAIIPYMSIPTGNDQYFVSDKYPRGGLVGALDWEMGEKWYSAINLGFEARQSIDSRNFNEKGRALGRIGTAYAVSKQVKVKADLVGATAVNKPFKDQPATVLEAMGGVEIDLKNHPVSFNVNAGGPLVRGATSPSFRADAGVTVGWGKGEKGLGKAELKALQPTLYFNSASAKIGKDDQAKLNQVAALLKQYPKIKLMVAEGHTDNKGSSRVNQKLSVKRATAVKNYLVKQKIASNRIEVTGFADTKPVASNNTDKGRAQNRRVELRVK
ncbi:OmpA family protein [bacterium]|nr:OmpA family protein [bacterium]